MIQYKYIKGVYSAGRAYRYAIGKEWGYFGGQLDFIGMNPPPTKHRREHEKELDKYASVAESHGYSSCTLSNLFGYMTNDHSFLKIVGDPVGPQNYSEIAWLATKSKESGNPILCVWGDVDAVLMKKCRSVEILEDRGANLVCFGFTKKENPVTIDQAKSIAKLIPLPPGLANKYR